MLQAVIFDFDGVITDTEVLHLQTFNKVLSQYGVSITTKDYYRYYLGLSDFDLFRLFIDEGKLDISSEQIDTLIKQKNQLFEELIEDDGKIIDGVRDLVQLLNQNNIPMAICSGALLAEINLILENAGLQHFFEVIVSAEHVTKGKPDPEGFLLALKRLNEKNINPVTADQCVVIEDSHWGIEAGKSAEMRTIAITNSYAAEQLSIADKVIAHLNQLSLKDLQNLCS